MSCIKVCYPSRSLAKKELKRLNKTQKHNLKSVYFCDKCEHFHLTSMSKVESNVVTKRIDINKNREFKEYNTYSITTKELMSSGRLKWKSVVRNKKNEYIKTFKSRNKDNSIAQAKKYINNIKK